MQKMEWRPQFPKRADRAFMLPHSPPLDHSPGNTNETQVSLIMCQALFQHFTCITWFHSFSKNSLSTDHVQDTSLDLSTEQTQTSCFHGSDTLVPQPINITWGVFAGGKGVGERKQMWMGYLWYTLEVSMNAGPILQMRKVEHTETL